MLLKNLFLAIFFALFLIIDFGPLPQKALSAGTTCYNSNDVPKVTCATDTVCHSSCGSSYVCAKAQGSSGPGEYCVLPLGVAKFVDNKVGGYDLTGPGLNKLISNSLFAVASVIGLIFFAQLVSGGIQYMMSSGDDKKLQEAQRRITNALVGLVVVVMSYWIVRIIGVVFGIEFLSPKFTGP